MSENPEREESQDLMNLSQAPPNTLTVFFPDGTKIWYWLFGTKDESKKEDLIRSTQSLHHYVHKYFEVTNRLLEILNTQMNENISHVVSANESESIEENCVRVKQLMYRILDVCEQEDRHVYKSTDSAVYDKITYVVSLKEKAAVIKELHENTMGLLGNVLCPLVTVKLAKSDLRNVMPPVTELKSRSLSLFVLGDLVQSSEIIIKHVCELQNQQISFDEAVQLMQELLSILKLPCSSYSNILGEVEAYVNILSETCGEITQR